MASAEKTTDEVSGVREDLKNLNIQKTDATEEEPPITDFAKWAAEDNNDAEEEAKEDDSSSDEDGGIQKVETVLKSDLSLVGFAKAIKSGAVKKIVTMAGAGISTSCGIPDFRTPGTGLYDNLQKYNLAQPELVFEINFFKKNPKPFYQLAKELYPTNFIPSPTHCFLRLLQNKGLLYKHYTQNIDGLERVAGITDEHIVEAHGTFATAHCTKCDCEYSEAFVKEHIFNDKIPKCSQRNCSGYIKPDIVFFGEALPEKYVKSYKSDFFRADMLIVMGTSLKVSPFCNLVHEVKDNTPRMLINMEKVGVAGSNQPMALEDMLALMMGTKNRGFWFDKADNYRDMFLEGTCDDGVRQFARELGWEQDLNAIIAEAKANYAKLNPVASK